MFLECLTHLNIGLVRILYEDSYKLLKRLFRNGASEFCYYGNGYKGYRGRDFEWNGLEA
jgi:hypothetical protein